jgi:uncharacterized protein (DUF697 family)
MIIMCFARKRRRKMTMMITPPRHSFGSTAALPLRQALPLVKQHAPQRLERREEGFASRANVLRALEDYAIYQAVLNYQPGTGDSRVDELHRTVSQNRLSTEELFGNPKLLANTYQALADEMLREVAQTNPAKLSTEEKHLLQGKTMLVQGYQQLAQDLARKATTTSLSEGVRKGGLAPKPTFSGWAGFLTKVFSFIPMNSYNSKTKDERKLWANGIIHTGSLLAGGTAGFLTKSFIADEAALTTITVGTIMTLSRNIYGVEGVSEALLATLIGKLIGARIAGALIKAVPGIGEIANAATAAGFHEAVGWGFYNMYEYQIANSEKPHCPVSFKPLLVMTGLAMAFGMEEVLYEHAQEQLFELEKLDFLNHRSSEYIFRAGENVINGSPPGSNGDIFWYKDQSLRLSSAPENGKFQTIAELIRFVDEVKEQLEINAIELLPLPPQMKEVYQLVAKGYLNKNGYDS